MERWWTLQARRGDAPPDDLPVLLAVEGTHGPVIHGLSRMATARGARIGQRVVDARAAAPDLVVEWADEPGDAAFLERLSHWCTRWSPWVAVDPAHGPGAGALVLDTTGVDHLFGGEAEMLRDIEARLSGLGLSSRLAVAPTRGAAWALARFGPVRAVSGDMADLDVLPLSALRLPPDPVQTLSRLGLKTVGQLRVIPRPALMRRFARAKGDNPLTRLDQALGKLPEPVAPEEARPALRALLRLPEPVQDPVPLLPDLARLLSLQLDRRGEGARRLVLTICRSDGETRFVEAGLARPTRDAAHMVRLFDGKLDGIDPGFGFDAVLLEAPDPERLDAAQPDLAGKVDEAEALDHLIDRLSARLGAGAVVRADLRDTHIPERGERWQPALYGDGGDVALQERPPRPLVLLDPPEEVRVLYAVPEGPPVRLEWRRRRMDVTRHAGPERIAPEWWVDRPGTRLRDYYRIEDADGCRYWLYREGVTGDGRGGAPRWFMHGLFP
ncbi:hypothetical protein jaqu_09750 [Jannaschia aquimarina]|uniref:Protein ImuB n=2 Tax=Jannaschia aquimarina TaxID=935700 RepID=A0A0D1EHX6_9RHOB|nr:hypothetical protein jaqu_09750 [Jannaschia aquimarina]SNT19020.1 protein ImuB [Jannaschia aquimarina]